MNMSPSLYVFRSLVFKKISHLLTTVLKIHYLADQPSAVFQLIIIHALFFKLKWYTDKNTSHLPATILITKVLIPQDISIPPEQGKIHESLLVILLDTCYVQF